ncbi:hypothetical protein Tco_0327520 [Tanacetum coccineum]
MFGTSTPGISSDVAELKDMVKALLLDKKNQSPAPTPVKAVEESCVTCGGAHSYQILQLTSTKENRLSSPDFKSYSTYRFSSSSKHNHNVQNQGNTIRIVTTNTEENFNQALAYQPPDLPSGQIYRPRLFYLLLIQAPAVSSSSSSDSRLYTKEDYQANVKANDDCR